MCMRALAYYRHSCPSTAPHQQLLQLSTTRSVIRRWEKLFFSCFRWVCSFKLNFFISFQNWKKHDILLIRDSWVLGNVFTIRIRLWLRMSRTRGIYVQGRICLYFIFNFINSVSTPVVNKMYSLAYLVLLCIRNCIFMCSLIARSAAVVSCLNTIRRRQPTLSFP